MNDTIEILDKDTNTKQTYVLKEELEEELQPSFWFDTFPMIVKAIIKLAIKLFKFSLYIVICILELVILFYLHQIEFG